MLASVSQHQRQKNGEQTRNRMRARAMNGYWVFGAIFGYRFERVDGNVNAKDRQMAIDRVPGAATKPAGTVSRRRGGPAGRVPGGSHSPRS